MIEMIDKKIVEKLRPFKTSYIIFEKRHIKNTRFHKFMFDCALTGYDFTNKGKTKISDAMIDFHDRHKRAGRNDSIMSIGRSLIFSFEYSLPLLNKLVDEIMPLIMDIDNYEFDLIFETARTGIPKIYPAREIEAKGGILKFYRSG